MLQTRLAALERVDSSLLTQQSRLDLEDAKIEARRELEKMQAATKEWIAQIVAGSKNPSTPVPVELPETTVNGVILNLSVEYVRVESP